MKALVLLLLALPAFAQENHKITIELQDGTVYTGAVTIRYVQDTVVADSVTSRDRVFVFELCPNERLNVDLLFLRAAGEGLVDTFAISLVQDDSIMDRYFPGLLFTYEHRLNGPRYIDWHRVAPLTDGRAYRVVDLDVNRDGLVDQADYDTMILAVMNNF